MVGGIESTGRSISNPYCAVFDIECSIAVTFQCLSYINVWCLYNLAQWQELHEVPKQQTCHTVLVPSFVLLHTVHTCLLLRNSQAVHSQYSICTCKPLTVLASRALQLLYTCTCLLYYIQFTQEIRHLHVLHQMKGIRLTTVFPWGLAVCLYIGQVYTHHCCHHQ